jgi:predicted heme/steroid binding protein
LAILRPNVSDNFPFFRPGFGLFERSFLGQNNRCVYVAYTVEVYDVATRQTIAWEWGGEGPCVRGMDNDVDFKKQFAEYSSDEQAMIRRKLDLRLDVSLRYSLEKLQLLRLAQPNTR